MKANKKKKNQKSITKAKITKWMMLKSLACFIVLFFTFEFAIYNQVQNDIINRKNQVRYDTDTAFNKVLVNIQMIENRIKPLMKFSMDSNGNINDLQRLSDNIIGIDYVRCAVLAPGGDIKYIIPDSNPQSNRFLVNLLKKENKDKLSVDGPILFNNGQTYLVINIPITDSTSQDSDNVNWGMVYAFVDYPDALLKNGLDALINHNYNFCLYSNIDGQEKGIYNNHKESINDGLYLQYKVYNDTWNIEVMPRDGWFNKEIFTFQSLIAFVISFLIGSSVFSYLRMLETGKMLTKIVNIDTLTGVYSRKYFYNYVENQIIQNQSFGIFYIDVDKFKNVNDIYGHEIGDKLLIDISKRIKECIRREDFIARIGGDEFVIYINNVNDNFNFHNLLARISKMMEIPFDLEENKTTYGLSIGFASFPKDGYTIEELIQKADRHMYNMKEKNHAKYNIEQEI